MTAPIRILTATAMFDGHDASINIIRRVLQNFGAEIIHLGHNHSVEDLVNAAVQEDVHALAISSYQGGHLEYFKYLIDCLNKITEQCVSPSPFLVFGGGGGTISQQQADELQHYGVKKIYTAEHGMQLGLEGMAKDILSHCRHKQKPYLPKIDNQQALNNFELAKLMTAIEQGQTIVGFNPKPPANTNKPQIRHTRVIGITGTGGSGKSTLIDELLKTLLFSLTTLRIAYLAIDPTRKKSGGALLGDRIRINCQHHPRLFMRSIATRSEHVSVTPVLDKLILLLKDQQYDLILIETAGIGQSDSTIVDLVDETYYVMTKDYGAPGQLEKIEMLDFADKIILNKCDQRGSEDAYLHICEQWQRNHQQSNIDKKLIPVYPMVASHFNDIGTKKFIEQVKSGFAWLDTTDFDPIQENYNWKQKNNEIIPSKRQYYLSEISTAARVCQKNNQFQIDNLAKVESFYYCLKEIEPQQAPGEFEAYQRDNKKNNTMENCLLMLIEKYNAALESLDAETITVLKKWPKKYQSLHNKTSTVMIHEKSIQKENYITSISQLAIPRISTPEFNSKVDLLDFLLNENIAGEFPFTAGVYPYRAAAEEPTRMFAGEGIVEDTNRRFFYLTAGKQSIRISTAFDPITLYGKDPELTPDVYGCIGMSGVSVSCIDDMKKLYSGINLSDKNTSVSMTINGPATILLAWFFNVAIDQQIEIYLKNKGEWEQSAESITKFFSNKQRPEYYGKIPDGHNKLGLATLGVNGKQLVDTETYEKIKFDTLKNIRGTLQADILKEELAQNECIFSLDFGLRLMADIQQYFISNNIKRFYSVSVSGYHIAEAGANPVTQLAFTLANGFTLVEYYLSRGMKINDFASQFSFFFSNGMDAEYAVIGRVARRIWARAMRYCYSANINSQKLKYHIQTSGRSLHAQDIELNDVRTTLQALYAIYDNCNSLHTNAYDEAVTTPTEESVHRALAIQMIINKELGLNSNQNPLQGSFIIKQLTDMVEREVYKEFDRLSERGGVPGAMETFYLRNKIQQQSMYYEKIKNEGSLPIVGVNTFVSNNKTKIQKRKLVHCSAEKKHHQIESLNLFKKNNSDYSAQALDTLCESIQQQKNSFACLMDVSPYCSLGQMTNTLLAVGGEYRRKI